MRNLATILACLAAGPAALAQFENDFETGPVTGESLVQVEATATVETVEPGQSFHLAYSFIIRPQWHIYWINPGSAGIPTTIEVEAPDGFEVGEIHWPRPEAIPGDEKSYGYEHAVTLFVPIKAPKHLEPGEVTFPAQIDWLVCKESCLLGNATRNVTVQTSSTNATPVDEKAKPGAEITDKRLKREFARVPESLGDVKGATVDFDGQRVTVTAPSRGFGHAQFFPVNTDGVTFGDGEIRIEGTTLTMTVDVKIRPGNTTDKKPSVAGVIGLGRKLGDPSYMFEIPLDDE